MGTVLIILLILILVGVFPHNIGYSTGWGYGPSGLVGIILIVVLILLVAGRL